MVYLGDGSGIAVMPSVPILVVCITNLILSEMYLCFRLLWAHIETLSYYICDWVCRIPRVGVVLVVVTVSYL